MPQITRRPNSLAPISRPRTSPTRPGHNMRWIFRVRHDAPVDQTFVNTLERLERSSAASGQMANLPMRLRVTTLRSPVASPSPSTPTTLSAARSSHGIRPAQRGHAGTIALQVGGMIDVRTNLPAPGRQRVPTYQWIQVVTTNSRISNPPQAAAANNLAPFVDGIAPGSQSRRFTQTITKRPLAISRRGPFSPITFLGAPKRRWFCANRAPRTLPFTATRLHGAGRRKFDRQPGVLRRPP